jgi:polysaccharide export outer membrane protein
MHRFFCFPRIAAAVSVLALSLWGPAPASAQTPPAPTDTKPKADTKINFIYRLTNTDKLRIMVYGEPDLSIISTIDARGNVNLYLIGDVRVAGCTVNEAQKIIETAYRDGRFLRNPQVTISVEDYATRTVTVDGQVKSPGPIPLPTSSTYTVYLAIMRAGGFTDVAKGSAVTVTRVLPDGTKKVFTVDVDSQIKGKDHNKAADDTLLLEPGDIIYVPERLI